jgi:4-hydroxy-2-oxoglutarate aldolase
MSPARVPPSGVWAPAMTFFDPETDTILLDDQKKYYSYLSKSGLAGLVILGTNSEAFLLTREERKALIAAGREACGPDYPIMAGCGAHSTKQVLELLKDAADAGADSALVLPPAYFGKACTPAVIERFYGEIATTSRIPIVIYNFPGVCNGVDLDSDIIAKLAETHENIVGVKLTCGSVAKITRLAAQLSPERFAVFGGQSDFMLGGLSVGSAGCIAAFANSFPTALSRVYQLYKQGKLQEAMLLHQKAAIAESPIKSGLGAAKYACAIYAAARAGIENAEVKLQPRHPYLPATENQKKIIREKLEVMKVIEDEILAKP